MSKENLKINVYNDIQDANLKNAWISLQNDQSVFPQMQYEWIEPWVRLRLDKRKLYIVCVELNQKIIAIAPFCIESKYLIKILKSIPIHFGDFYSIIGSQNKQVLNLIINHLKSCKSWNIVHFFNVNDKNILSECLREDSSIKGNKIVEIHEAVFDNMNFNDFLLTLSKNTRGQYRNKWNRLSKLGTIKLEAITDYKSYESNFKEMIRIYNLRWKGSSKSILSDEYYKMRNEAIKPLFKKNEAILYKLDHDGVAVAYRLGFLFQNTFFEWKVVFNPEYNSYSPGNLLLGKIIEDLIAKNYCRFNFMTGDYRYKRSWVDVNNNSENYEYLFSKNLSIASLYVNYRLKYREKIKKGYYKFKGKIGK